MTTADCSTLDDQALATRAAGGDRSALEALLERHAPTALSFACTVLGNRDDALDVSQNALIQLAGALSNNWRGGSVRAYLYASVHHAAINLRSQNAARRDREQDTGVSHASKEAEMPGERMERDENLAALREEMLGLPQETASLLALYHLDGLQVAEIAQQMALSVDACKSRLMRGRDELRERLEKRGIFLAATALPLDSMLDKGFAWGKTMAAKTDAAALAQMVRQAMASTTGAVQSGSQIDSPPPSRAANKTPAQNSGAVEHMARPAVATGLIGRIVMLTKEHPFAAFGGVAAAILVLIFAMGPDRNSTAADRTDPTVVRVTEVTVNNPKREDAALPVAGRNAGERGAGETKGDESKPATPPTAAESKSLAEGSNAFACDMYGKLKDLDKGNLFYSPYSISSALNMTFGGARGNTAVQMAKTLRHTLEADRLHAACGSFLQELNGAKADNKSVQLSVANRLFGQSGYAFLPPFLDLNRKTYGAPIEAMEFNINPEGCRKSINQWVEQQTQERIKDLIPPGGIDKNVNLVLTNAIYFKGLWTSPFNKKATKEMPFNLSVDKQAPAMTMRKTGEFKFMEEPDSFSALEIQYKGDELSMLVLLPAKVDGLAALEKSLSTENIKLWSSKLDERRVDVSLPRFSMTWGTKELSDVLKGLGMTDAFVPGTANFSGMTADPRGMFISQVYHKAFVEVNEEGTEAAAATAVVMKPGAAIPPKAVAFKADHPFIFMIRHNMTGNILFMGRMMDPR